MFKVYNGYLIQDNPIYPAEIGKPLSASVGQTGASNKATAV
jgi:hypothetical protein